MIVSIMQGVADVFYVGKSSSINTIKNDSRQMVHAKTLLDSQRRKVFLKFSYLFEHLLFR